MLSGGSLTTTIFGPTQIVLLAPKERRMTDDTVFTVSVHVIIGPNVIRLQNKFKNKTATLCSIRGTIFTYLIVGYLDCVIMIMLCHTTMLSIVN